MPVSNPRALLPALLGLGLIGFYFSYFAPHPSFLVRAPAPTMSFQHGSGEGDLAATEGAENTIVTPIISSDGSPLTCFTNELGRERKQKCVFPFKYRGKMHEHCLGTFWDDEDKKDIEVGAWCSTTKDFDKDQKWGYCEKCSTSLPHQNEATLCPSPPNSSWCYNWPKANTQECYYLGGIIHYCDAAIMRELWKHPRQCKKKKYTIQLINIAYDYMKVVKTGHTEQCPCHCEFLNHGNVKNTSVDLVLGDIISVPANFRNDHAHAIRVGMYTESPILHSVLMSSGGVNMFNYDAGYGPYDPNDKTSFFRIALYPMESQSLDMRRFLHTPPVPFSEKKKTGKMMATWISNCGIEATGRNGVVSDLQREGITFAHYGHCFGGPATAHEKDEFVKLFSNLDKTDPGAHEPYQALVDRFGERYPYKILVSSQYLFYAAFENSDCDWYHTEKPYHALYAGTIPVYIGASTISKRLPKGSFIHLRNFTDAKELATLLHRIANNETEYNKYLEWRKKPMAVDIYGYFTEALQYPMGAPIKRRYLCELCEQLDKVYGDDHKDMLPDTACKRGAWKQK